VPPAVPVVGAYFGAGVNPFKYGQQESDIEALEAKLGRRLALDIHYYYWSAQHGAPPAGQHLPGDGFLDAATVAADTSVAGDARYGRIPVIAWRCGDNLSAIARGDDDAIIIAAANALRNYGRPVFLRWFYEFNLMRAGDAHNHHYRGCFTTLCKKNTACTSAQQSAQHDEFIAAWSRIWSIFKQKGATNVAFALVIAGAPSNVPQGSDLASFIPRGKVDWLGIDSYDKSRIGFVASVAPAYKLFAPLKLPIAIIESGENSSNSADCSPSKCNPGPWYQANWFKDAVANIGANKQFSAVHGFIYSDQSASSIDQTDWSLDGPGIEAFADMGKSAGFQGLGK